MLTLYAYDRLHSEVYLDEKRNRDEAARLESRSLRQHADTWYLRFSDPTLLKVWVEGHKEGGCKSVRDVCHKINGATRKNLKEKHGIDCSDFIKSVF